MRSDGERPYGERDPDASVVLATPAESLDMCVRPCGINPVLGDLSTEYNYSDP